MRKRGAKPLTIQTSKAKLMFKTNRSTNSCELGLCSRHGFSQSHPSLLRSREEVTQYTEELNYLRYELNPYRIVPSLRI